MGISPNTLFICRFALRDPHGTIAYESIDTRIEIWLASNAKLEQNSVVSDGRPVYFILRLNGMRLRPRSQCTCVWFGTTPRLVVESHPGETRVCCQSALLSTIVIRSYDRSDKVEWVRFTKRTI